MLCQPLVCFVNALNFFMYLTSWPSVKNIERWIDFPAKMRYVSPAGDTWLTRRTRGWFIIHFWRGSAEMQMHVSHASRWRFHSYAWVFKPTSITFSDSLVSTLTHPYQNNCILIDNLEQKCSKKKNIFSCVTQEWIFMVLVKYYECALWTDKRMEWGMSCIRICLLYWGR